MAVAINVLLFQAGWFACVLGAARGFAWEGAALAFAIAVGWVLHSARPRRELALVGAAVLAGLVIESALAQSGWVRFAAATPFAALAPVWMVALWALFATTLNVSLRRLRDRTALSALFGALGGPAAYYAGARLGALHFEQLWLGLVAIGVAWALATPLLFACARRLEAA